MKMNKTKAIISTLAVALVITTSLAILNVTRINNDKKKGAAADMQSEQTLTQTLTKESEKTTQENIEETTVSPKKAVAKAPQKSAETTQTTAPNSTEPEIITIPQNQTIKDNSGNTITFYEIYIRKGEFIVVRFKHERENTVNIFMVNGYDMTYTSNTGNTMGKPDGFGTKYKCVELTETLLAYDPNVTSITVSYTFPDGTNASVVLSLN